MRVTRIQLRDFRNYERAEVELGDGLTVVAGPNGAGKTNLLEALYFGCTARSCRTSNERELVRRGGEGVARVVLEVDGEDGEHRSRSASSRASRSTCASTARRSSAWPRSTRRPLVGVFLPERLELVKGAPVAAPRPPRPGGRRAVARPRGDARALLARARAAQRARRADPRRRPRPGLLDPWDAELARHGVRADGGPRRGGGAAARRRSRELRATARPARRRRSCATGRARTPPTPTGCAAELRRAPRGRPRARLHRARPAPRRAAAAARRPAAARIRLAGPAARGLLALLFAERDVLLERARRGRR